MKTAQETWAVAAPAHPAAAVTITASVSHTQAPPLLFFNPHPFLNSADVALLHQLWLIHTVFDSPLSLLFLSPSLCHTQTHTYSTYTHTESCSFRDCGTLSENTVCYSACSHWAKHQKWFTMSRQEGNFSLGGAFVNILSSFICFGLHFLNKQWN